MNNITRQLVFASILFICTVIVVCFHLFGYSYTSVYEEVTLPEKAYFSSVAVIPPQSTQDNVKESSFSPIRIYGAVYGTADCAKLLTTVKIMLMLIAIGLFIKPERYEVEFILDSDGMK